MTGTVLQRKHFLLDESVFCFIFVVIWPSLDVSMTFCQTLQRNVVNLAPCRLKGPFRHCETWRCHAVKVNLMSLYSYWHTKLHTHWHCSSQTTSQEETSSSLPTHADALLSPKYLDAAVHCHFDGNKCVKNCNASSLYKSLSVSARRRALLQECSWASCFCPCHTREWQARRLKSEAAN